MEQQLNKMIDKTSLVQVIKDDLQSAVHGALAAADEAHATATNKENAAENKYDTLGLEAAYLAHGQSERVMQLTSALEAFRGLRLGVDAHDEVTTGSLVSLEDDTGHQRVVFVGPAAGGQVVSFESVQVTVVTHQSPLGHALLGAACDDEVSAEIAGKVVRYTITSVC